MTRTSDVVVAFMAAHGSHALRSGAPVPYPRLRHMYGSDEACRRCARFGRPGAELVSFEVWAREGEVERLGIIHPARVLAAPPRLHSTGEGALDVTRDLNGGSNLLLVARRREVDDLYRVTQAESPRVALENADVLEFVEQAPASSSLQALWLEWNASDKWLPESDWAGFARAARAAPEPRLVEVASRVLARVSVSDETRRAWHARVRERTPAPTLSYEFRFAAACQPVALLTDLDGAHADLLSALDAAIAYAQRSSLADWTKTFEAARQALDGAPGPGIAWTLFEGALAPAAQRLLDAAWRADVFGGMGSWNDVRLPPGQEEIGSSLHAALVNAVQAAINSP